MILKQFSKYLSVGLINFLVCILTMKLLSHYGVHYLVYTALGYGLAICCSYLLNLKYTFELNSGNSLLFIKFFGFNLMNLFVVECIEFTLISQFNYREVFAILIGMTWYTGTGFFINKFFIYRSFAL